MSDKRRIYASAFLCEKLLTERQEPGDGGTTSAIRIIDTITSQLPAELDIEKGTIFAPVEMYLLVVLKSDGPVEGNVTVYSEGPNSKAFPSFGPYRVKLLGGPAGHNLRIHIIFNGLVTPGLYWFNVQFDDEIVQRYPLEIKRVVQSKPEPTMSPESEDGAVEEGED